MEIKKDLPFKRCEDCHNFVLSVKEQVFYVDNVSHRELLVTCKNAWLCKQIEHETRKSIEANSTM